MKTISSAFVLSLAAFIATPSEAFFFSDSGGSVARYRSANRTGSATVLVYPGRVGCFTVLAATRHAPAGASVSQHVVPLTLTVAAGRDCSRNKAIYAATVHPNPSQYDVKIFYVDQSGRIIGSEQIAIGNR